MSINTDPPSSTNEDFRLFMARIMFGMLFLVMAIQMSLQQLPYQLPIQKTNWLIYEWVRPSISIIASTAVLIGFFIPTRGWSILTALMMLLFNFSYLGLSNNAFYNFIWWVLLLPFCLKPIFAYKTISKNKWLVILFAAANWLNYGLNWVAIPIYLLYFLPFLPFKTLFQSFNRYYEPR